MINVKKLIVSVLLFILMLSFAAESKAAATYYDCDLDVIVWTDDDLSGGFDSGEEIPLDEAEVKFEPTSPATANGALSLVSVDAIAGTGETITVKRRNVDCTGVVDDMSALPTATYRGRAIGPNGILGGLKTEEGSVVDFDNGEWLKWGMADPILTRDGALRSVRPERDRRASTSRDLHSKDSRL